MHALTSKKLAYPRLGHHNNHFVGFHHGFHRYGFGAYTRFSTQRSDRYSAYANITLHKGDEPEDDPHAYDASEVRERLKPMVGVSGEG